MEDTALLWERYRSTGSKSVKDALLEHYLPFVKQVALGILKKLWAGIEMDDLVSDGTFGLMRAIEQFEPERGIKFETYATPVIKGAIYNGLRDLDWMPERTRAKVRSLQSVMERFMMEHGRPGTEEELARELKITSKEVQDLVLDLFCMYIPSIDQPFSENDEEGFSFLDVIEDKAGNDPVIELEVKEDAKNIKNAIKELDEDEKNLIKYHYYQGITFEDIAEKMGISLQKVSQIHRRVMMKLNNWLRNRDYWS